MAKLTDMQIKSWIKSKEHFEQRADGGGLYLSFRATFATPKWLFRYRFDGRHRIVNIGSYSVLSLADARKTAKELSAKVALGHDVAEEKQDRKREATAKINAVTVAEIADEYFERVVKRDWKRPETISARIEKDIKPRIGKMKVEDVTPRDVDSMLQAIVKRGSPSIANDVLRWSKRIFNYAIKRHIVLHNPASAFGVEDAGGEEKARDRWLSREEIIKLFEALRNAVGPFPVEYLYAIRLLLLLAVRKEELVAAPWSEFDLDAAIWSLPPERTKTGIGIDIPLPPLAVDTLRELHELADGSVYVLPARQARKGGEGFINPYTLNHALTNHIRPKLEGVGHFTLHDLRRTARTHLAALGVDPIVAERCLNHKLPGVAGTYNRHDYFDERKAALAEWAKLLGALEEGRPDYNVVSLSRGAAK